MSKNLAASVIGRLKNISKDLNIPFNLTMQLYAQERFLYRLSKSEYKDDFLLKGGLLLYSMEEFKGRPTKDIDFLLKNQDNNSNNIIKLIKEIIKIEAEDGIVFDLTNIKNESIMEGTDYKGQRIKIIALIGNARIYLQVDIGFGDVVVPAPVKIKYPILLDFEQPKITAYSLETVIAEKFNAMVSLALLNSRMKDFYDIHSLMRKKDYQGDILKNSIQKTFKNRNTKIDKSPIIFSDDFQNDPQKIKQWGLFLKRINEKDISYKNIIKNVSDFLEPVYDAIYNENDFSFTWNSKKLKWIKK